MLNSLSCLTQLEPSWAIIRNPLLVTPETIVMAAILRMRSDRQGQLNGTEIANISPPSCILVVEDDRPIGILTTPDLVRLIAARRDVDEIAIQAVMTPNPVVLRVSAFTDIFVAIELLDRHQIGHLPVVDDRGCLVGLLTRSSLQQHIVAALATKVAQQDAQLQEQQTQVQAFCDRTTAIYNQAKLELGESQQFIQTVFDTFPLAVFWKDRESRFLGCNQQFAAAANLDSPADIIGKSDYDLPWGADEADTYRADDRQVIESGIAKLGTIETQTRSDGTSIWLETNKLPLRNLNGDTIGVLGTSQDITERQQAETQLRQTNHELARATQLKDEFLANMSHELRTPLNAILGMSEALQNTIFGPVTDRQQKSLSLIEKSGKHLLALINDILDLSKIEANKFDLDLTDVSIRDLCQNSILFVKELALKKQLRLTTQIPDYLHHINIQVDDRRCRQVLINLLSNAVKFTPPGGSVTLDIRVVDRGKDQVTPVGALPAAIDDGISTLVPEQPSRWIVFSIIDTGIGIAPDNIDKLFKSFVQIDSSLSRQYAGTGLGLALVKRIVELHGGTVSAQSELDRGSCFTVSLPFCPSVATFAPPSLPPLVYPLPAAAQTTPTGQKAVVLVAEDNHANMETMTGYLKSRGYRPIEASNGRMAIDLAQLHHPDIILMDIQMPDMDGFAAIRQLRQIPECAAMPIVALTALAMPPDRQKCLDAGANEYVTKPVKLSQLVLKIEALLAAANAT